MDNNEWYLYQSEMNKTFPLENQPIDYQISVHIKNMFAAYGEQQVRDALAILFGVKETNVVRNERGIYVQETD